MSIPGAFAAAVVDYENGVPLGADCSRPDFDVEMAACGNCRVVRTKTDLMRRLSLEGPIEDILITLPDQHHLIRQLTSSSGPLFLYLALDRNRGNLGMARRQLAQLDEMIPI